MEIRTVLALCAVCAACEAILSGAGTLCDLDHCACDGYGRVVCDCGRDHEEVTIRSDGAFEILSTATNIEVSNCKRVFFLPDAIRLLRELRQITVRGVARLTLSENSWHWGTQSDSDSTHPGLRISVTDTDIADISSHAIKGRIDDILFNSTIIRNIRPYAFSDFIGLKSIEILNSTVDNIETQAFKKFTVDSFVIKQCTLQTLPSRTMSDLEVRQFLKIDNSRVKVIRSSAFIVRGVSGVYLENSNIDTIEGDAFRVSATGPAFIRNNEIKHLNVGAFAGLSVPKHVTELSGPKDMLFENNTIAVFETGSLRVNQSSYNLVLKDLKIKQLCQCDKQTWKTSVQYFHASVMCVVETPFGENSIKYKYMYLYEEERCANREYKYIIIAIVSVCSLLVVLAVVLAMLWIVRRGNRRGFSWIGGTKRDKPDVVMPDGKTYRETELHVIVERAQLLTTDL